MASKLATVGRVRFTDRPDQVHHQRGDPTRRHHASRSRPRYRSRRRLVLSVSGRAKRTSEGQVKTGHLRSRAFALTACAASGWLWEAVNGERAQDGQSTLDTDVACPRLVSAADRTRTGRASRDRRPLLADRGLRGTRQSGFLELAGPKPAKPARRVRGGRTSRAGRDRGV